MANPKVIEGLDGLRAVVGQQLGVSDWRRLEQQDLQRFAEVSGDFQWIHTDPARCARESPYRMPVAHGYFSLSRIGGLFFEVIDVRGFALVLNYGTNRVRFPAPLKVGARYRLATELVSLKDVPKGVEAVLLANLEVEGEAKPACAAEVVYRFLQE